MTMPDRTLTADEYYAYLTVAHFARCVCNVAPATGAAASDETEDLLREIQTLRVALEKLESALA